MPGTGKTHDQRPRAARRPRPRTQPSADGASPASFARGFQGNLPSLPQTPSTVTGQTRPRRPLKHKPPPDACRCEGRWGRRASPAPGQGRRGFCFSHASAHFLQHQALVSLPLSPGQRNLPRGRRSGRWRGGVTQETRPRGAGSPGAAELRPHRGQQPDVREAAQGQMYKPADGQHVHRRAGAGRRGATREGSMGPPFPVGLGFSDAGAVERTWDLVLACSKFSWDKLLRV